MIKNTNTSTALIKKIKHSEEIKVMIKELILTPLTCASIINEIIKLLVYQKSQIPYPYHWLKSVITRKREKSGYVQESAVENLKAEHHFGEVSSAYDALQELMLNLNTEFQTYGYDIKQVLILFGATVYSPKEVYRIRLSDLLIGHSEDNHLYTNSKKQHTILKHILLDEQWMAAMETLIPPTNMFILIQKKSSFENADSFFQFNEQYSDPVRIKNTTINLLNDNIANNCCGNLRVFSDKQDIVQESYLKTDLDCTYTNQHHNLSWYQAKVVIQGFKKCYVNKVSATELW